MVTSGSDPTWIEGVLARWERPLVAYALRITRDLESARDVVQETFLRLLHQDRADIADRLAPWLFTVCRRLALDEWRKEQRTMKTSTAVLEPPAPAQPERAAEHGAARAGLMAEIDLLPNRQQELLRLRFDVGLSYREMADVTGLSVSNVGYLLHMALRRLRETMGETETPTTPHTNQDAQTDVLQRPSTTPDASNPDAQNEEVNR